MLLEKTIGSPLDCKEIKLANPKGNIHWKDWCWSWTSSNLATWCENWLIGKDPDAGKDGRPEKRMMEDEMIGWHHRFNGLEFEQAPGVGDGQGSLVCWSPCYTESWTLLNNWTEMFAIGRILWLKVLHMSQNKTEKDISLTWKDKLGKQKLCVCVMGQVVGMDEQTAWPSSLIGSVSVRNELIPKMSY